MAISSYKVFLMKGTGTGPIVYSKLIDIKDFPDLGGKPESLDTTTLSDGMTTSIPGIEKLSALEFSANYTKTDFQTLKDLEGTETDFAVYFGGTEDAGVVTPDGADGKFTFKGFLNVYPGGAKVNAVVDMKITITPSTVIAFA